MIEFMNNFMIINNLIDLKFKLIYHDNFKIKA